MSSPLRTQFINHLTLHRRSPKTKEAYISAVYGLARHYLTSPDKLSDKQINVFWGIHPLKPPINICM